MAFRWRTDDGPTLNADKGIRTSINKEPYIFVIFQGKGVRTPCPPLNPHMNSSGERYSLIEFLASMGHSSICKLVCAINVCNIYTCIDHRCSSIKHPQHKGSWIRHCYQLLSHYYSSVQHTCPLLNNLNNSQYPFYPH